MLLAHSEARSRQKLRFFLKGLKMARYEREFFGMPGEFRESRGLDPNYVDGYHGMRMGGGYGRAAYGSHRLMRERDLETEGGYYGTLRDPRSPGGAYDPRWMDPRWERSDSGHSPYDARRAIQDFNSHSPEFAGPPPRLRYDADVRGRDLEPSWGPQRSFRRGYTNRGITDAGYSEGWARGPMRGSR